MITKVVDERKFGTNRVVLIGLSTDTKPVGPPMQNGYEFREMDTRKTFFYDQSGKTWRYWDTGGGGGGGGTVPDEDVATDGEAEEVLDDIFGDGGGSSYVPDGAVADDEEAQDILDDIFGG